MPALVNKLLVALACLSAALAPMFTNVVLCTAANGHVAIERAHDTTGCPEAQTSTTNTSDEAPCTDVPVPRDELTVQISKLQSPEADRVPLPPFLYVALTAFVLGSVDVSAHPPNAFDTPPATSLASALALRSTVLLI